MRSITALVLAHLASSLVACQKDAETTTPAVTPPPDPSPTPTPILSQTAPTPSVAASDAGSRQGASCTSNASCGPGFVCAPRTDGAHLLPGPGTCWLEHTPIPGGRPLYVDGVAHVSRPQLEGTWHERVPAAEPLDASWRDVLARAALDEHASVAAFARTICQLMALGAPASLIEKTQRALADEIVHARRTFEWVERAGGERIGPGPLPQAVAAFPDDVAAFMRDVFHGGCIGETLAAHEAAERAESAPSSALRAYYANIAEDEARHAALAFETALWLMREHPETKRVLDEDRRRFEVTESTILAPLFAEVFGTEVSS